MEAMGKYVKEIQRSVGVKRVWNEGSVVDKIKVICMLKLIEELQNMSLNILSS